MFTKKFMRCSVLHLYFLLLLLFMVAQPAAADTGGGASRFLGLQFGSITSPLGEEDPYAFPLGVGLFFEFHPQGSQTRFFWGGSALYYRFNSRDPDFEDSFMVQAGLQGGFDIILRVDGEPAAALTPLIGFKEYYREYRFRGERISAWRGVAVTGMRLSLLVAGTLLVGFDIEYNLLLEEDPLDALACYQRLGIGF